MYFSQNEQFFLNMGELFAHAEKKIVHFEKNDIIFLKILEKKTDFSQDFSQCGDNGDKVGITTLKSIFLTIFIRPCWEKMLILRKIHNFAPNFGEKYGLYC